jgi:hypothetical protein
MTPLEAHIWSYGYQGLGVRHRLIPNDNSLLLIPIILSIESIIILYFLLLICS